MTPYQKIKFGFEMIQAHTDSVNFGENLWNESDQNNAL